MDAAAHAVKKTVAAMTTGSKVLEDHIPSPYSEYKARAVRERKALHEMVRMIDASGTPWASVIEHQKEFAELVEREAPMDGTLHSSASTTAESVREGHKSVYGGVDDKTVKMAGNAKALALEIEDIEKEFKGLEVTYSETERYEKKVDKLAHKEGKEEKVVRNTGKLEGTRAAFQSKLDAVLQRMERSHNKYEVVMEGAQTAYWLRSDSMLKTIDSQTSEARSAAHSAKDRVLDIDVTSGPTTMADPSSMSSTTPSSGIPMPSMTTQSSTTSDGMEQSVGSRGLDQTESSVQSAAERVAASAGMTKPKVVTTTVVVDGDTTKPISNS